MSTFTLSRAAFRAITNFARAARWIWLSRDAATPAPAFSRSGQSMQTPVPGFGPASNAPAWKMPTVSDIEREVAALRVIRLHSHRFKQDRRVTYELALDAQVEVLSLSLNRCAVLRRAGVHPITTQAALEAVDWLHGETLGDHSPSAKWTKLIVGFTPELPDALCRPALTERQNEP